MQGLTNTKEEFQQFKDNFAAAVPLGSGWPTRRNRKGSRIPGFRR